MKAYVLALAAVTTLVSSSPASQTRKSSFVPKGWSVSLFDKTKYRGSQKTVRGSISSVEQKWRSAKSMIIVGQWEVCTGANFTGECRQLRSSIADLEAYGFPGQVKSIRPIVIRPKS